MRSLLRLLMAALCVVVNAASARADDAQFTVGAGLFEVVAQSRHVGEVDLLYRFGQSAFHSDGVFRGLHPVVGVMGNARGGAMAWAGVAAPLQWAAWEVAPSVGAGAYHRGNSKSLGGTFQFHLGFQVSRAVNRSSSLGLAFMHISNGGIHDKNPGANSVVITWTWRRGV